MKNIKFLLLLIGLCSIWANGLYAKPDKGQKSTKSVEVNLAACVPASAMTDLDYNNVRATILNGGDMWYDFNTAQYEVPKGSGKNSLYAGAIWVGGVDVNGQLRVCAQTYRSTGGNDFWPGPLVASGEGIASVTADVCTMFDRHYKINKIDVTKFVSWYNSTPEERTLNYSGYAVPSIISQWPAQGPIYLGEYDNYLAPFKDVNHDGNYDVSNGDYPGYPLHGMPDCNTRPERYAVNLNDSTNYLRGDQTLWWVYNDKGNVHTATTGADAIGMEFRAQAFAFSTNDELNNMTFYNYEIINRSTYTLNETYFGVWTDADLGKADDDYVGCDVSKGFGYLYNGYANDGDGTGNTYGLHPPAVGIDFFEGPYQDANNNDDPSNWDPNDILDCNNGYRTNPVTGVYEHSSEVDLFNGNVNGLNFGDGIKDNERWGMRRFIFYNIGGGAMGDPKTAIEYYNYLKGIWMDNRQMTYGGDGHSNVSAPRADFMFPGSSDPCGWGTAGIPQDPWSETVTPGDRRLVQSAGPFTLEPGTVNYITLGAVWARDMNGDNYSSINEVVKADDKAQKLFENCFQLLDGPDAPELNIVEMDGQLIFHIFNNSVSNNYLEKYDKEDPFISRIDVPIADLRKFKFQGYQVFQLKNEMVTINDVHDANLARLVFQCDIKDGISRIVNFVWDEDIQANIPVEEVNGSDNGITHTFTVNEDKFSSGARKLVNYKKYFYVAIAYAHNDYRHYNQTSGGSIGTQTMPYRAGRKGAEGGIKTYPAIPHPTNIMNNGTIIRSEYGDTPEITQLEGHGNGNNVMFLSAETIQEIMSKTSYPFRANDLTYVKGYGPIAVKVIDPLNVTDANFLLKLLPDSVNTLPNHYFSTTGKNVNPNIGLIMDTKWTLYQMVNNDIIDSVTSDAWIRINDEKIISKWGISIKINQVDYPDAQKSSYFTDIEPTNGGILDCGTEYQYELPQWLYFLQDQEGTSPFNWIRSGTQKDPEDAANNDYAGRDPDQNYERILGGTWAPYFVCSKSKYGPAYEKSQIEALEVSRYHLNSVDLVITKNKALWTRCAVVEMCENDEGTNTNTLSEGHALRFDLRRAPSIDKDGNSAQPGDLDVTNDVNAPNYIGATGMSWFPGYVIDVQTGERLNIMFGEDSWLIADNGRDMLFNPSSRIGDELFLITNGASGTCIMGGKHFIYIMGHNFQSTQVYMPSYDEGRYIYSKLKYGNENDKRNIYKNPMWVCIPMVAAPQYEYRNYNNIPNNAYQVSLRVANPYHVAISDLADSNSVNQNYPMYRFSLSDLSAVKNNFEVLKNNLDRINIVPNPYYGYSTYEQTQLENIVKITNLPNSCTITIFNVAGSRIRKFIKNNDQTFVDWDLKNDYGISIAGGVYIIHIDVPGAGEKILKWFGALRPIDLNNF